MKFFITLAWTLTLSILASCAQHAPTMPRCVTGGCSGQLCIDAREGPVASTCEWRESYGCYQKHGQCLWLAEEQRCGWAPNTRLENCLKATERSVAPQ